MIEDASIDAVYVPLPNALHHEWVMKALDAGKHVLCEKSLGCTEREAMDMVGRAEENGLALVENFQFRFHQQLEELRDLIGLGDVRKNVIGDLRTVRCSFGFPPFPDAHNIRYQRELGGGALLDAGAYMLKIAAIILGDHIAVRAASLVTDPELDVDLHGSGCLLDPDTGVTAHVAFGFDHHYRCGVEVWGSEGLVRTNRLFTAHANVEPVFEIETASGGREEHTCSPDNHFVNMLRHFHSVCNPHQREQREEEYRQNLVQARLLGEFQKVAGEP